MALPDLSALAQRFVDRADADADEAFNRQHDLARRELAAVESVEAAGRERWRRDQLARAAATAAASGDDGARFGPLDDDEPDTRAAAPSPSASAAPASSRPSGAEAAGGDDDEGGRTWLR